MVSEISLEMAILNKRLTNSSLVDSAAIIVTCNKIYKSHPKFSAKLFFK